MLQKPKERNFFLKSTVTILKSILSLFYKEQNKQK